MIRKKVDQRIKTVIDNSIINNHRSFFVIIGDKGREQIVNLHRILTNAAVESQPSVLWCYKKELGFTANRQKRMSIMKKKQNQGQLDKEDQNVDSFELFLTTTQIRWSFYKETHKILGSTFGMLVLQDFEAITPNILARTVETVSGGGIVVMLLKTMSSLKQLYSLAMDQHNKFRTESHHDVVPRFNERFLLSLIDCETSLFMDDELNILPISLSSRKIVPCPPKQTGDMSAEEKELLSLKETLLETPIVGSLLKRAKTLDQGKALIHFFEAISEKTLRNTVALTAGRGRGKSAALGLAIAGAVAYGYANIFVTSPSPENLQTLFQFVMAGFDQLEYKEHTDYELVQSTNPGLKNVIVRINIFKSHRQVIQYILPTDCAKLGQAELLVIDEAAAIPLPYVRALLGPYLVFMSSTINGYEGTGRSLSLKLIKELKERGTNSVGGRTFREIELKDPIRYSHGDSVEKWLNQLLCLDCTEAKPISACPLPAQCELYYVNRNTLFSYHKISEKFLHDAMSLYVSSHYKNSPNDLMLISDAPGHHLFVLLPPTTDETTLPDILCVVQIAFEGAISKESVFNSLSRGKKPNGDLIPWTVNQQFQDDDFPSLSGARIVRIATHPQVQKMGYGTRAVEQLVAYFEGKIGNLDENNTNKTEETMEVEEEKGDIYSEKKLRPKKNLPPLLMKLSERPAEPLHYIGTSFGMTQQLFSFWKKVNFLPVYLRQTELEITGEHSCIMLRNLNSSLYPQNYNIHWRDRFHEDFAARFASLLGFAFKKFTVQTALQILAKRRENAAFVGTEKKDYFGNMKNVGKSQIDMLISPYDLKRLDQYVENLIDHHAIMDLVPTLAKINFVYGFSDHVVLSQVQYCILLGVGLQYKQFEDISRDLNIQINQVMALYKKAIKKFVVAIKAIEEKAEEKLLPENVVPEMKPNKIGLEDELNEAAGIEMEREQRRNLLDGLVSPDFIIQNDKSEWDQSTSQLHSKVPNIISVKRKKMDSPHVTKEVVLEKDKNIIPDGVTGKFKPEKKKKTSHKK